MSIQLKTLQEIREETPGLKEPGQWYLINVAPRMAWPSIAQSFAFEDHEIWLVPITEGAFPGLAVRNPKVSRDEAYSMLYRALSVISWLEDDGATVESRGGGRPFFPEYGGGQRSNFILPTTFDLTSWPVIESDAAKLALALMREGRGLNHPAYSFLSFYRVIELAFPDGKARGIWMSEAVERLSTHTGKEALGELRKGLVGDVGKHLRHSGRGAVAHANWEEVVANPDNPMDYQRLQRERPIIEALAAMVIEEIFKVQTSRSVWEQHLYELSGWKPLFGAEFIDLIVRGSEPPPAQELDLPEINVRLRRSDPFEPLERLRPIGWAVTDAKGEIQYRSRDSRIVITFVLDFLNERLIFPLENGINFDDDGTVAAARVAKILTSFNHAYNGNGELQIWNTENGSLMSKCDAFVPVNVIFNPEGAKAELDRWNNEIVRRALKRGGR